MGPFAAVDADASFVLGNAESGTGAVLASQGIERPIGFGAHADAAVGADQNGHRGATLATFGRGERGFQEILGLLCEAAHTHLIAREPGNFIGNSFVGNAMAANGIL